MKETHYRMCSRRKTDAFAGQNARISSVFQR